MSRYLSLVVMLACTPSSTTSSEGRTLPPTDAPVAASAPAIAVPGARPEKLRVRITGVIAPSGAQSGARPGARAAAPAGQPDAPLEICPGERLQVCSGVALAGTVAPGLVSTPGNVVVARITGLYDGARLELEGPSERIAPAPEPDHRNPCPQYQSPLRGGASPSNELRELAARIEKEHPERHAGSWWDQSARRSP